MIQNPQTKNILLIAEALAVCAEKLVEIAENLEQTHADELIDIMRNQ